MMTATRSQYSVDTWELTLANRTPVTKTGVAKAPHWKASSTMRLAVFDRDIRVDPKICWALKSVFFSRYNQSRLGAGNPFFREQTEVCVFFCKPRWTIELPTKLTKNFNRWTLNRSFRLNKIKDLRLLAASHGASLSEPYWINCLTCSSIWMSG